jgi:hypothetical protein
MGDGVSRRERQNYKTAMLRDIPLRFFMHCSAKNTMQPIVLLIVEAFHYRYHIIYYRVFIPASFSPR